MQKRLPSLLSLLFLLPALPSCALESERDDLAVAPGGKADSFGDEAFVFSFRDGYALVDLDIGSPASLSCEALDGGAQVDIGLRPFDGLQTNHLEDDGLIHFVADVDSCADETDALQDFVEAKAAGIMAVYHGFLLARPGLHVEGRENQCDNYLLELGVVEGQRYRFASRGELNTSPGEEGYCEGAEALVADDIHDRRLLANIALPSFVDLSSSTNDLVVSRGIIAPTHVIDAESRHRFEGHVARRPALLLAPGVAEIDCTPDGRELRIQHAGQVSTFLTGATGGREQGQATWTARVPAGTSCGPRADRLRAGIAQGVTVDDAVSITGEIKGAYGPEEICSDWLEEVHGFELDGLHFQGRSLMWMGQTSHIYCQ